MARRFFRVQGKGYTLEQMQSHVSEDWGEDGGEEGLAVSGFASGLDGGARFGGSWDAMNDDDEVIVLEGDVICKIYDGYRIYPTREVARFTVAEWARMLEDGTASDWE